MIWMLGVTLGLASCSGWLTVEPKSIMEEEDMFSRETGFKEALAGVYLQMASGLCTGGICLMALLIFWGSVTSKKGVLVIILTKRRDITSFRQLRQKE